jgi:hypothetical protein
MWWSSPRRRPPPAAVELLARDGRLILLPAHPAADLVLVQQIHYREIWITGRRNTPGPSFASRWLIEQCAVCQPLITTRLP